MVSRLRIQGRAKGVDGCNVVLQGNDVQRLRQLDNALEAAKRQNLRAVELEQSLKQLRADKEDLQGQTWMDESICSLRGSRVA